MNKNKRKDEGVRLHLEKLREFHQPSQKKDYKNKKDLEKLKEHKNWKKLVIDLNKYISNLSYFKDDEDTLESFDINMCQGTVVLVQ
jgi:hypothetical protein